MEVLLCITVNQNVYGSVLLSLVTFFVPSHTKHVHPPSCLFLATASHEPIPSTRAQVASAAMATSQFGEESSALSDVPRRDWGSISSRPETATLYKSNLAGIREAGPLNCVNSEWLIVPGQTVEWRQFATFYFGERV